MGIFSRCSTPSRDKRENVLESGQRGRRDSVKYSDGNFLTFISMLQSTYSKINECMYVDKNL